VWVSANSPLLGRRPILRATLALGSLVLMGGVGGALGLRGGARAVSGLRALSDQEYTTVAALASALFPSGEGFAVGADDVDLARAFDAFLVDAPSYDRSDLKKAIFLVEYGPMIFEHRATTFRHLSASDRLAHFTRWAESEELVRRQAALALRKILSVLFYDRPEVWPHIGYDGPLFRKAGG
jgi:hypothetical protein